LVRIGLTVWISIPDTHTHTQTHTHRFNFIYKIVFQLFSDSRGQILQPPHQRPGVNFMKLFSSLLRQNMSDHESPAMFFKLVYESTMVVVP
jgi:hypothetical protein